MSYVFSQLKNAYEIVGEVSTTPRTRVDKEIVELLVDSPFGRPTACTVLAALDWRRKLYAVGFDDVSVFPGYDGEIMLSAIKAGFCFEVTIEWNRTFTVSFERNGTDFFHESDLDAEKAREKLIEAARLIWILSVGFIRVISIPGSTGLPASPSRTAKGVSLS